MKLNILPVLVGTCSMLLAGCQTPSGEPDRTATGALTGGAIGAASGALIGGRHSGEGALIGGALGVLTGGLIGHSMDQEARARARYRAATPYVRVNPARPLSLADIKALAAAGLGEDLIVSQIRNSRAVFQLSSADIIDLKNSGVSEKVIDFMINTAGSTGVGSSSSETVVLQAPPPRPVETVIVAPGQGRVWVDGGWNWHGRWVWGAGHWGWPHHRHGTWHHNHWGRGGHGHHRGHGHWR